MFFDVALLLSRKRKRNWKIVRWKLNPLLVFGSVLHHKAGISSSANFKKNNDKKAQGKFF
jgi:hypothetical protein